MSNQHPTWTWTSCDTLFVAETECSTVEEEICTVEYENQCNTVIDQVSIRARLKRFARFLAGVRGGVRRGVLHRVARAMWHHSGRTMYFCQRSWVLSGWGGGIIITLVSSSKNVCRCAPLPMTSNAPTSPSLFVRRLLNSNATQPLAFHTMPGLELHHLSPLSLELE